MAHPGQTTSPSEMGQQTMPQVSEYCEIHKVVKKKLEAPGFSFAIHSCDECEKENTKKEKERERQQKHAAHLALVNRLRDNCQIGKRFSDASFDNYKPINDKAASVLSKCRSYAEGFKGSMNEGGGLLFLGNPGTGKNHLAAAICNTVIEQEYSALHTTVLKMIRRIKATWSKGSEENESDVIASFQLPHLLVIDEVGVQFDSKAEQLLLTEIINDRYEWMLPTILISNLTAEGLKGVIGDRVIDRFRENSEVLVFDWNSYRRKGGNA